MTIESFTTGADDYGRWIKMLVVGAPGSGKTLMSSTFPNPYYACAEPGLMSVADRHIRGTKITTSDQLKELVRLLEQPRNIRSDMLGVEGPIDTVVLDTIDEIQQVYIQERMQAEKLQALRLQDYGWLAEKCKSILRRFRNLDMHVIWTCHEKRVTDDETSRTTYEPGLAGQISEWVPGQVDLAFTLTARARPVIVNDKTEMKIDRKLQSYPDAQHPWIKDRSGKLPSEIPVDFNTDYVRISKFIFGDVQQPVSVPEGVIEKLEVRVASVDIQEPPAPVVVVEEVYANNCSVCQAGIPDDQTAISKLRFRTPLCNEHFQERANKLNKEKVTNG